MPTYQYACTECGEPLEVVQSFTDDALTTCPTCGGRLRKLYSGVGIVFKGSGFYRNDSRAAGSSSEPARTGSAAKSDTSTSASSTSGADKPATSPDKTSSTPAKAKSGSDTSAA